MVEVPVTLICSATLDRPQFSGESKKIRSRLPEAISVLPPDIDRRQRT